MKKTLYACTSALPAIAAALALSSTPALAQDAPGTVPEATVAEPAPVVSPEPAPTLEAAPVTAPEVPVVETPVPAKRAAARAKVAAPAAPRAVEPKTTVRTARAAAPAAPTPAAAPAAPSKPAPVVDLSAKAAPAPAPAVAEQPSTPNNGALEVGAGALALLAIGGGAAIAMRRRRRDEDEVVDEAFEPTTVEPTTAAAIEPAVSPRHDPIFQEEPPMIAPSAFAWGNAQPAPAVSDDDGSDRRNGESWVDRAYRGPSPANPSVSLRTRLKRAAFFDKREREVAAGKAQPIEADAGLPEAMVEEQERELA